MAVKREANNHLTITIPPEFRGKPIIIKAFRVNENTDFKGVVHLLGYCAPYVYGITEYNASPLEFDFNTEIYNKGQHNVLDSLLDSINSGFAPRGFIEKWVKEYKAKLPPSNLEEVEEEKIMENTSLFPCREPEETHVANDIWIDCLRDCAYLNNGKCQHNSPDLNFIKPRKNNLLGHYNCSSYTKNND